MYVPPNAPPADESLSVEFYRQMYTIRRYEEAALELFARGILNGTVHTCVGQECCAVGVINALDKRNDIVFSNHRGHGHYLALTDDVEGLAAEMMGRIGGCCGGVGGSQHLHRGNFYSNGVQGGIVPVATGMALAEKEKGSDSIVVAYLGDGTLGEGVVYESFNIASKWSLPILYVIENNGYAQTTPIALSLAGRLQDRPAAFGIDGSAMPADDVLAVCRAAASWVHRVRSQRRPAFLCLETYRLNPHSKGDDTRSKDEVAAYRRKDPLVRFASTLDAGVRAAVEASVESRLRSAVDAAMAMPKQDFAAYRQRIVSLGGYAS